MTRPTVALCIPAYNAEKFLPRLLQSAITQTIHFDEIWIYDDSSTDNTAKMGEEYGATVVRGDVNRGCAYGKNKLAELTRCDWIHFHDADDELYPNFVQTAHKWMLKEDGTDVVLFAYEYRDSETNELLSVQRFDNDALRSDPVRYTIVQKIINDCGLYRRSSFLRAGGFDIDPNMLYNEDAAMHCRLARAGLRFAADPTVTAINYRMPNSMSCSNQIRCAQSQYHVLKRAAEDLRGKYAEEISHKLWGLAGVSASYLDWKTAYAAVDLAVALKGKVPTDVDWRFKAVCFVSPYLALRVREYWIRLTKPQFRGNSPHYIGQIEDQR